MRITRFLLTRIAGMIGVLLLVSLATFLVFYLLPADPARAECGKLCLPGELAQVRAFMGLNEPVWRQYLNFLGGIFTGRTYGAGANAIVCAAPCLGYSFQQNTTVLSLIGQTLPVTASIAVGAAVLWLVAGVLAGVVSALRHGRPLDRVVMTVAIIGVSAPAYLVGLLAILLFGFKLNILPDSGYVPLQHNPGQWAFHLILPWCVLAFISAAIYARLTRSQMLDALGEDYVRTARAKGLRERSVVGKHALRNVMIPVITIFGLDFGSLLGGAVITEKVFSMYGLGALLIGAVESTDLSIISGVTLLAAVFVIVANFLVDVVYKLLDPRVLPARVMHIG
jgi:peptide/nickel transport system permease protein